MFKRALSLVFALALFTEPSLAMDSEKMLLALNLSRVKTWSAEVLTHTDLNAEFDNILNHSVTNSDISASAAILGSKLDLAIPGVIGATTPAAGTFTALTINGNTIIGNAAADTLHIFANTITAEGATDDTIEHIVTFTDPTSSDKTLTIPNASSVTLPTGAVFFMVTGTCPAGTTNVSATYADKFIKINATAGTSSAGVFTSTSASTDPGGDAHTHTVTASLNGAGGGATCPQVHTSQTCDNSFTTNSTGSGNAHTHTTASATTNEPSSITMILCQVS